MIVGREALGGLVHDQELRVQHQRAADREHLLLAAGELRAAVPLSLGEAREELVDARGAPAVTAVPSGDHAQVLVDAERREEPAALRDVADAQPGDPVRALADELRALEADGARDLRRPHTHDRRAQGGLPHAVAADDRDGLLAELERHVREDVCAPVAGVQALDGEERGHSR